MAGTVSPTRLLASLAMAFGLCVSFPATLKANPNTQNTRYIVTIKPQDYRATMATLKAKGYDIAGVNYPAGTIDIIVAPDEMADLTQTKGVREILAQREVKLTDAPDSRYKTPEQIGPILKAYAEKYPTLATVHAIGKSLEGRDIWAIEITRNAPSGGANKPAVLFNGLHHAREVMAVEVPLDTIDYLLSNYQKDPKVRAWVDGEDIWVVPMVNPDGSNKVWTSDNMWRKNARGDYGVDINRNYPYQWDTCNGSSGSRWAEDYRGAAAASEPETQAIMTLVKTIRPVADISYHSYSELVLYPYGCDGEHANSRDVLEETGKNMASLLPSDTGSGNYTPGTPWEVLYAVDGDDIDWMYHDFHVLPYVIELNSSDQGFQPDYDRWRDQTVSKLRPAWQLILDRVAGSGIRGHVSWSRGLNATSVTVENLRTGERSATRLGLKSDGTFQIVLNPGMYHLSVARQGQAMDERDVTVGKQRLDFQL